MARSAPLTESRRDDVSDALSRIRATTWSEPDVLARRVPRLLGSPLVAQAGAEPRQLVERLGQVIDRLLQELRQEEQLRPPAWGRSVAYAGCLLLKRPHLLTDQELATIAKSSVIAGRDPVSELGDLRVDDLQAAIALGWPKQSRKGVVTPLSFKEHSQASVYDALARQFLVLEAAASLAPSPEIPEASPTRATPRVAPPPPTTPSAATWAEYTELRLGFAPARKTVVRINQILGRHGRFAASAPPPQFIAESWDEHFPDFSFAFARLTRREAFSRVDRRNEDYFCWVYFLILRERNHRSRADSLASVRQLIQRQCL